MEGNHVDGLDEILRLVDCPVITPEEIAHEPEEENIERINSWYDLIASACRWLQNIGLTMTDHVPVYWYDVKTQSVVWDYADELLFRIDKQEFSYQGPQLFDSAIDYFGSHSAEELKTAIMNCDVEEAERLMEIIKQAMKEYI
ncbi:MAG: hypothetical protein HXL32_05320 [Prevotellaceae bacterium]|nr:hypothetical protein [Prevotellaceae bacterium]